MKYALCSMLGYAEYAKDMKLSQNQIDAMVAEVGFFKNVQYKASVPMTKAEFAVILKDALMCNMIYKNVNEENLYDYDTDSKITMLEEYLSVQVYRGIVNANKYTSIADTEGLNVDDVLIGDMQCAVGTTNAADYIGCKVEAYIKVDQDDDTKTVLRINYKNCNVLVLNCEDIEFDASDFTLSSIVYNDSKGRKKKAKVSSDADFFYNNRVCVPDKDDFKINNGTVTLVSNENGSVYDVVKIEAYENYVVDHIDTANNIVYDKIKNPDGSQRTLDLSENDKILLDVRRPNGRPIHISDLKRGNVLTVYKSKDGGYVRGVVSNDVVDGSVTAVNATERRTVIRIDNEEYQLFFIGTDWGANQALYPTVGAESTFYLDANGFVTYVEYAPTVIQYGFVTSAGYDIGTASGIIKLTDEEGVNWVLSIPDQGIKINNYDHNAARISAEDICEMLKDNHQLIQVIRILRW